MKKVFFIIMFVAVSVVVFGQQKKNEVRWRDLQGISITGVNNITVTGSYPSWTITSSVTPTLTSAALTNITATTATITTAVITNPTLLGAATTKTLTVTGNVVLSTGVLAGSSVMRGHAAFTNTQKVVRVAVPGLTTNDYVFVQANQADTTTAVLAADNLTTFIKADTLIVIRPGSGTSGLAFDWFRVK